MRKLLVIVLVSFLCIGSLAARGEFDPYEPNDTFAQAYGPLASGAVYEGYIESSDDLDYFYLQMPSSGLLEIMLDNVPSGQLWLLAVYDYRGDIEHLEYASSREVTHWDGYLSAGRYYVKIDPSYSDGSLSEPYRLWAFIPGVPTATPTGPTPTPGNDPYEPNDTFAQAYGPLASGAVYEGYIESSDDLDYFYLQMPSSGLLEIMLDNVPSGQLWLLAVYDYRGDIEHLEYASSREVTHWDGYLSAGRYYVKIDPSYSDGSLSEPYRLWAFIPGVPTATLTRTPTMAPTWTPTNTVPPTETGVPTITATASPITPVRLMWLPIVVKPRATPTARPTLTGTPTITLTPTQTRTPVPTATRTPEPGWVQIVTEGFEGAFPTGLWYTSQESEEGNYTWGPRDCRPHTGIRSAWCVGAGADGSLLACGSEYPDEVETQLVYGPFDLRQATAAKLTFWTWSRTQYESDTVYWGASRDGWLFWGERDSGADDVWRYKEFDLSRVPEWGERTSYLGEPEVWIMFSFESDEWYARAEGWYIDDVQIVKREGGSYAPSQPDVPSETGVSKWRIAP